MIGTTSRHGLRAIGVLVTGVGLQVAGTAMFADPAWAHCPVNIGTCAPGGHCTVNTGYCGEDGYCTVNAGTCYGGCWVNAGDCYSSGPTSHLSIGAHCSFSSTSDPAGEEDVQTGQVSGIYLPEGADVTASITLRCTIQLGATGAVHAGSDAASVEASGTGAAVLAPTVISYVAPHDANVYACTAVTVNGTTFYWDSVNAAWSTSNTVACDLAISQEVTTNPDPLRRLEAVVPCVRC